MSMLTKKGLVENGKRKRPTFKDADPFEQSNRRRSPYHAAPRPTKPCQAIPDRTVTEISGSEYYLDELSTHSNEPAPMAFTSPLVRVFSFWNAAEAS